MNQKITGKVAVVTGGTRGIGRSIVERLLDEGMRVGICATRQKSVDEAVAELSARGEVFGMAADVSQRAEAERMIAGFREHFGALHVLVNNAAVAKMSSVGDLAPEDWDRMIAVNLSGPFYTSHAVLPIYRAEGGG